MRRRRVISWLAGGVVVLAACGSPLTNEPAAQPDAPALTAPTDAPVATSATVDPTEQLDATVAPEPTAATTDTTDLADTEPTDVPERTTTEPVSTDAPAPEPTGAAAAADDGCSIDNTATDVAGGPVPTLDVRAESAANPLPDLAVRRINCAGGWVNLKNEVPADKPLLVWFYAPH